MDETDRMGQQHRVLNINTTHDMQIKAVETLRRYYRFIVSHVNYDQVFFEYRRDGEVWLHCSVRLDDRYNRHQAFPNYVL